MSADDLQQNSAVGTCPRCRVPVIAREAAHAPYNESHSAPIWRFSILICDRCGAALVMYGEDGVSFDDPIWLYPAVDELSQLVPNSLRIELSEAKRLALSGFDLPAVLMCGRTLEGLAHLHDINERTLMRSLEKLKERGLIDEGMYQWASKLRVLRNIAAHFGKREDVTREDADDAIALTEAILDYVYVFATHFEKFKQRRRSSDR